jgi:hypothetical protein
VAIDSLAAGGQDYLTITSLSARHAFGGVQLVGTISKMYMFLKEISSDGNTQTVDVVFPAHPIFITQTLHFSNSFWIPSLSSKKLQDCGPRLTQYTIWVNTPRL